MVERTDVDVSEHFDEESADEYGAEQAFAHYELDEETFVKANESLGQPVGIPDVNYVIGYRVDTPLTTREKYQRAQQSDDIDLEDIEGEEDLEEAVEDRVTFGQVYHSNEDGERGMAVMQVETEDSLDEIIEKFAEE
jgi:hypothetical protein